MTPVRPPSPPADARAAAHRRFARAAIGIYLAAGTIAVLMLVGTLAADRAYDEGQRRQHLLLETEVRANALARQLAFLAAELQRLGLRSEVDLLDHNLGPERQLLALTHERSAFFNVGVGIVNVDGRVVWGVPQKFLAIGSSLAAEPWFAAMKRQRRARIVPVQPDRHEDALLYVVSPVVRGGQFAGALVGAVDLGRGETMPQQATLHRDGLTVLAMRDGTVVYPPRPPVFAAEEPWRALFRGADRRTALYPVQLSGRPWIAAAARVGASGLTLLALVRREVLSGPTSARLQTRLAVALSLVLVPLALLVLLLTRSLAVFRRAEEHALREERLRDLGEATNLIAHEVKNALNGLRLGVDVVLRASRVAGAAAPEGRAVTALRQELQRLTDFTSELLIFSKGITPRPVPLDLAELVRRVSELAGETAAQAGVTLDVEATAAAVPVVADPTLLHVVISNLVTNAVEAAAAADDAVGGGGAPRVSVRVRTAPRGAEMRVEDNGRGVAEHVRQHLFEPFVTGKPSGVGIGLALSRKIARAHGGDLVLERAAPGACFLLTVPAPAPSAAAPAAPEEPAS